MRDRAWRRYQAKRVQRKRYQVFKRWQASWESKSWLDDPRKYGRLKKNHYGCKCFLCKNYDFKYLKKKYKRRKP